jgi:hypothetical protein
MTLAEARAVARIVGTADHGCPICVGNLIDQLNGAGLGFVFESTHKDLYAIPEWDREAGREKAGIYVRIRPDQR